MGHDINIKALGIMIHKYGVLNTRFSTPIAAFRTYLLFITPAGCTAVLKVVAAGTPRHGA